MYLCVYIIYIYAKTYICVFLIVFFTHKQEKNKDTYVNVRFLVVCLSSSGRALYLGFNSMS